MTAKFYITSNKTFYYCIKNYAMELVFLDSLIIDRLSEK